jgi:hypothetical protein
MADFERFLKDNNLKKIDIADYLQVSKAFITQLCNGSRRLPPEKFALLQAKGWDTTALLESDQPSDNSNNGNITKIGNLSGVTNSPTTVNNNGGSAELMKVIAQQAEQIKTQHEQIQNLTEIIKNLTAR